MNETPDAPSPKDLETENARSAKAISFTLEEQEEFDAWNRASDRALEAFERLLGQEDCNSRTAP